KSKIFVAVTLERLANDQTRINIYTLLGPPYKSESNAAISIKNNWYWRIGAMFIALSLLIIWLIKRKSRQNQSVRDIAPAETGKQLNQEEYSADVKAFSNVQYKNAIL